MESATTPQSAQLGILRLLNDRLVVQTETLWDTLEPIRGSFTSARNDVIRRQEALQTLIDAAACDFSETEDQDHLRHNPSEDADLQMAIFLSNQDQRQQRESQIYQATRKLSMATEALDKFKPWLELTNPVEQLSLEIILHVQRTYNPEGGLSDEVERILRYALQVCQAIRKIRGDSE